MAPGQMQVQRNDRPAAPVVARGWWGLVLLGGVLGMVGTVWQTVERLAAARSSEPSLCDLSAVVSCGSVYGHWQSSALGVPNSLIGLPVFAVLTSAAAGALLGSVPSDRYVAGLLGLDVFMTAFVFWYLEQTAFAIGALCLFCSACMVTITLTGIGLTRVADARGALGRGRIGRAVHALVESRADLAVWVGLLLVVALMLLLGLPL